MPTMSFQYVEENGFHRPKVPFTITANGNTTETVGLVDSGSDFVLLPAGIARALGITLSRKKETAGGVGGEISFKTGLATMTVRKGNKKKVMRQIKVRVHSEDEGSQEFDEILLGRDPFFKYFKIEFDENAKKVRLHPNRRSP